MELNDLTYLIRGAIFKVHSELGPGLFENVYEAALMYELEAAGLSSRSQVILPVFYKHISLEMGFKLDILYNRKI